MECGRRLWPTIVDQQLADVSRFKALSAEISEDSFAHLVVLGIAPEVLGAAFGKQANAPQLKVLDSTDPAQIRALRAKIDPARTLFCVSSKSGRTLEANLLLQYFYEETSKAVGTERAGHHFLAVTDPGSPSESLAHDLGFRRVYHGCAQHGRALFGALGFRIDSTSGHGFGYREISQTDPVDGGGLPERRLGR